MIRLSRRPAVRMTAVATVLAGTGLVLSGAAAATGQQLTRPSLDYTCRTPGWRPIRAQVTVSIPGTGTAGQPIKPAAPDITVTLPRADDEHLGKLNASAVSVTAQLDGEATGNGKSVADPWLIKAVAAPVPSDRNLVLQMPGGVQPVTEPTAGNVTFTAVGLSLLLAPQITHGAAASATPSAAASATPSAAATPAPMRLDCTLNPGQTATLATVPVVAAAGRAASAPSAAGPFTTPSTGNGHFLTGLWQSAPGGSFSGTAKKVALTDAATGTVIACTSSSMTGTFRFGQQLPSAGIGSFSSVTLLTCTGPGGKTFTIATSAAADHPWLLNAQSIDLTLGVTTVTISGIMARISGPGCSATVAGPSSTAPGTVEAANSIVVPVGIPELDLSVSPSGGTLRIWNVSGCSGLFNSGDVLTFTATYTGTAEYVAPAYCPPFPVKTGFPFNPHFKLPPPPPGSTTLPPQPPVQACAFIEGFSDVQKLGAAALVGPGFGNVQEGKRTITDFSHNNYLQTDSTGRLYYKPCPGSAPQCQAIAGLPPVHATFLSFGFMPTTATLQITQVGTLNIVSVGVGEGLKFSRVQSLASIRVEKVLVNGAPLNVGSDCHTVRPFPLVLTGKPPYSLNTGGVLDGTITVPPFTGCGVGENLDPIFNASVSGPANFAQLTQGTLCFAWNVSGTIPERCPANVPKPVH